MLFPEFSISPSGSYLQFTLVFIKYLFRGHEKCVDLLLEFDGLDIDRRSNKGTTALHDAAESNNVSIFEKLLKKGAKFLRNELQVSPLLTASLGGHEKIVSCCNILPISIYF